MTPRERLLTLLKHDILKLDLAELNFGVYCILNERRGRGAPYSVPYDGADVYIHGATKGSHYGKSSEFLKCHAFRPDGGGEVARQPGLTFDELRASGALLQGAEMQDVSAVLHDLRSTLDAAKGRHT